ncbi:MAG: T9SS type A sorting domain-containing protein [Ignavibacteriales bacterium]|nr:T9SS type A sorting domain-containing protein [Ignavibacteriales bacterium]
MKKIFIILAVVALTTILRSQSPCPGTTTIMYEGKLYNTVLIGNQCWLKENIDAGIMVPGATSQSDNSIIEKYCYGNLPDNCATYGGMYQWGEAVQYLSTQGTKGICPEGWHIPSKSDFLQLTASAGNNGYAYLAVGQDSGTNTTGFSALLAGFSASGQFGNLGAGTSFWSSGELNTTTAYVWYPGLPDTGNSYFSKGFAISIRCINNNPFTSNEKENRSTQPEHFTVEQNYPNPFNPSTIIRYQLPLRSMVTIRVYDALGKELIELVSEEQNSGYYSLKFDGSRLSSGLYICEIVAGNYKDSIKMLLLK